MLKLRHFTISWTILVHFDLTFNKLFFPRSYPLFLLQLIALSIKCLKPQSWKLKAMFTNVSSYSTCTMVNIWAMFVIVQHPLSYVIYALLGIKYGFMRFTYHCFRFFNLCFKQHFNFFGTEIVTKPIDRDRCETKNTVSGGILDLWYVYPSMQAHFGVMMYRRYCRKEH